MPSAAAELLERLDLAESLRVGSGQMQEPQDLPGRYGRVIRALDRVLQAMSCPAAVAGGWAVWRHGYVGRVTQDVDIVVPADRIDEFLSVAAVSGFERLLNKPGTWPKVRHKDTDIQVDLLPEGERPGTPSRPAPTTIPHPAQLGAVESHLAYVTLKGLIELKLAAGRVRDDADVVELLRANPSDATGLREHLSRVHADYVARFDELLARAMEQSDP